MRGIKYVYLNEFFLLYFLYMRIGKYIEYRCIVINSWCKLFWIRIIKNSFENFYIKVWYGFIKGK